MLNINPFKIKLVDDPVIEIFDSVKTEVEDEMPEMRGRLQPLMTPDSIGERQSGYDDSQNLGSSSRGQKRSRTVEQEVEEEEEEILESPRKVAVESDYEDDLEELDELEDDSSDVSEYDIPLNSKDVGSTSGRMIDPKERSIPSKDREAYEWLKRKLENWNFKGGRTAFIDKLRRPVSHAI